MRPFAQSEAAMSVVAPLIVGVAMVVIWEIGCRVWHVPIFLFPKPSDIALKLMSDWPTLLGALGVTLRIALQAFGVVDPARHADRVPIRAEPRDRNELLSLCGAAAGDADRRDRAADHHPGEEHAGRPDASAPRSWRCFRSSPTPRSACAASTPASSACSA